jgi:hypothetical protein
MKNRKEDYIPANKLAFDAWLTNFVKELEGIAKNDSTSNNVLKVLKPLSEEYSADMTAEQELLNKKLAQFKKTDKDRKEAEKISRGAAQTIKNSLNYTEEMGRKFGIIGAEIIFDAKTFRPDLDLRRVSSGVEVSFNKSETDGINLYRRNTGDTDWRYMARDTHSPYIDTKKMDEHASYEYMAWAVIKDKEIGLESDIASITV